VETTVGGGEAELLGAVAAEQSGVRQGEAPLRRLEAKVVTRPENSSN